jgi:hypothetical protein
VNAFFLLHAHSIETPPLGPADAHRGMIGPAGSIPGY